MDPSTSPPSEALKQSLAAAVEAYRETCFQITFPDLQQAVADANESVNEQLASGDLEEEVGYERFAELKFYHFNGEYSHDTFSEEMEEEIGTFNRLLEPDIARKVLPAVAPPPSERMAEHLAGALEDLQRRVSAQAVPGKHATFPAEYRVFATLAYQILPPGLPDKLTNLGVTFSNYPSIARVPSIEELDRRLNLTHAGCEVYAGFFADEHATGEQSCNGWVLCEKKDGEEYAKDTTEKWRIVFSFLGDSHLFNFNTVGAFLKWYAGYGVSELCAWDIDAEEGVAPDLYNLRPGVRSLYGAYQIQPLQSAFQDGVFD